MSAVLEVRHLTKRFGGVVANKDVSISVPAGGIVGLIGPNGSGKTTLFNCIAGTHPVDDGSIIFSGRELTRLRPPQIARLGIIRTFQQTRVYRNMTAMQNMQVSAPRIDQSPRALFARVPAAATEQAGSLLDFVDLYGKRLLPAGDLSFGQQKLLELAMALMNRPSMLLLDEPTAGVNPTLINGVLERLRRVNEELGITLLIIEHNMRVIMTLARHIYCLAYGELLASGTPEEVRNNPRVIDAYLGAG
jgi:ABC-type branched-subunit amino acid transport system ATPase component